MSTTKRVGLLKIAAPIIVLVAVGFLLVASGDTDAEQDPTLEEQIASCQTQLVSLEQLLEEIRQTNLAQWARLQSQIEQMRIDHLSQATTMQSRFNQTREDYIARIAGLESQLSGVREEFLQEVTNLETQLGELHVAGLAPPGQQAVESPGPKPTPALKIAYLNTEDAFSVFTAAVSDLRQKAIDKQMEIARLQQDFMAGRISKDEYQNSSNQLQAELLQAQLNIDIGTIDRMIASPGFGDMRSDLQRLRDESQPVVDEMKNLVTTMRTGVVDTQKFQNRYTQVKDAFTQLDQLLTQAATTKIVQAAAKVAVEQGYDLVLHVKNVIIYRNTEQLIDITDLVKRELELYL